MKKIISSIELNLLLATIVLLSACAEPSKKIEEEDNAEEIENTEGMEDTYVDEEDLSIMLPSPLQIAAIFNKVGLEYHEGLINQPSNIDKYNTKTSKYLNFGIYSADLAYAVLNDKQQSAIDILNAIKTMSEEIGMSNIFSTGDLIKSFEENISNQDTILYILTEIKQRTDDYLEENSEESKEAIFFSAAWLEGMYIGSNSLASNDKIAPRLVEQMTILDNIIRALDKHNDETLDIGFLIEGLNNINSSFKSIPVVDQYYSEEIDLNDVELNEEDLNMLKEKITSLRTEIVEG